MRKCPGSNNPEHAGLHNCTVCADSKKNSKKCKAWQTRLASISAASCYTCRSTRLAIITKRRCSASMTRNTRLGTMPRTPLPRFLRVRGSPRPFAFSFSFSQKKSRYKCRFYYLILHLDGKKKSVHVCLNLGVA